MRAPAEELAAGRLEDTFGDTLGWLQETIRPHAPRNKSAVFFKRYPFLGPGPAARTLAGASNFSKFLAKRADRSAAALSYAALSFQASRAFRNSGGTPGAVFGTLNPNAGSGANSALLSLPSMAARTMARV